MTPEQASATIERLLNQQAFTMAVTDVFLLSSALFVLLVALVWFAQRPAAAGAPADAGGAH